MFVANEKAVEARGRPAARRCGLRAMKSRRGLSGDNYCGFRLVNDNNLIVAGKRFDMSAEDVLDYCKDEYQHRRGPVRRALVFSDSRAGAVEPVHRAMPIKLWSDESKTFEHVDDGPLTPDEIADMRELWRRATPERLVQLMALTEGMLAREYGEQPHQGRAGGQRSSRHARSEDRRGCQ